MPCEAPRLCTTVNLTVSLSVYQKVNDKLILLNNNEPYYASKLEGPK